MLWGQPWGQPWGGVLEDEIIVISSSSSAGPAKRTLTLRQQKPAKYVDGRTQGYLLVLEVVDAVNVDPAIFVFQRNPATIEAETRDTFSNIASPSDLEEYPVDNPEVGGYFFRKDRVELVFRNLGLLFSSLADLKRDLHALIETLNQMDSFVEDDIVIDGSFD